MEIFSAHSTLPNSHWVFSLSGLSLYHKRMKLICYQIIEDQIQHCIKQCLEELGDIPHKMPTVAIIHVHD